MYQVAELRNSKPDTYLCSCSTSSRFYYTVITIFFYHLYLFRVDKKYNKTGVAAHNYQSDISRRKLTEFIEFQVINEL